jgi:plasmid stabilization system protein ParE
VASRLLGIDALDRAAAEVVHEAEYYFKNGGPAVARGFLDDFERTAARIVEAPHSFVDWPRRPSVKRALLARYPFAIGFVVGALTADDPPLVVVVAHGKRRPGYWFGRASTKTSSSGRSRV